MVEYRKSKLSPAEQRAYDELLQGLKARHMPLPCHGVVASRALEVCKAIFYDHPELYYMGHAFSASVGMGGTAVLVNMDYVYSEDEIRSCEAMLRRAVSIVRTRLRASMDEFEKIVTVAEYVVRNCDYEIDFVKNQNAAAAICYHKAQCSGYARAITYILDKLGIWSIVVDGYGGDGLGGGGPHAWNMVKVGSNYYHLDVTFMEAYNVGRVTNAAHAYLFYDDVRFAKDHEWDKAYYPACTDSTKAMWDNRIARETDPTPPPRHAGGGRIPSPARGGITRTPVSPAGKSIDTDTNHFTTENALKTAIRETLRKRKATLDFTLDPAMLRSVTPLNFIRKCFDDAWEGVNLSVNAQIIQVGTAHFKLHLTYP